MRFSDCDPAGIVFFPQYLVMVNGVIEEWFNVGLKLPYAHMIASRRTGLPTVRLEVDFTAISHHGDELTFNVEVEKLGRSSLTELMEAHGGDELRMRVRQVLVCTSLQTHKPQALPDDIRNGLLPYVLAAP